MGGPPSAVASNSAEAAAPMAVKPARADRN
jgi:hypothetical protein